MKLKCWCDPVSTKAGEELLKFCQNNEWSTQQGVSKGDGTYSYSAMAALGTADSDASSHLSPRDICNARDKSLHAAAIPEQLSGSKFADQITRSSLFTPVHWGWRHHLAARGHRRQYVHGVITHSYLWEAWLVS